MSEKREPSEEELENAVLRARNGLDRAIERYIARRRESREDGDLAADKEKTAAYYANERAKK